MTSSNRLRDRIALVTGASRGIGRAVAVGYAREGAHVIAVARTQGALEEVDDEIRALGGTCSLVPLDLANADKLDALGPSLYQRWQKLDIVAACAGILGTLSPLPHISGREWAEVLNINLTANWRLIRTLDPLLRASDAGRAIFVTSSVARSARPYWGAYAVSKAGLETLARIYAAEMQSTNVRVNILDPGGTRTGMRAKAFPGEDPQTLKPPEALVPLFIEMALPEFQKNGEIIEYNS